MSKPSGSAESRFKKHLTPYLFVLPALIVRSEERR